LTAFETAGRRWDLVVVGGGILGLATAREWQLRRPSASVLVLEQEDRLAGHQTTHNSGVVHAGIYYKPGSLKAELCARGRDMLYRFCDQHEVRYEKLGKLIVAVDRAEVPRLDELELRGRANGVPGLRRIAPEEIRELEPHATGVDGLYSPETGIVDFGAVATVLAEQLRAAGAVLDTGVKVTSFTREDGHTLVASARGTVEANRVIACAGAWSDRLAVAAGAEPSPRIVPFRGAYLKLVPSRRSLVRSLIYPVPDPSLPFLGVHLTRHIDGDVLLGPTALMVGARNAYSLRTVSGADLRSAFAWPGTWKMMRRWWRVGLTEMHMAASRRAFVTACARYVPELSLQDVDREPGPAGVRAQAVGHDGSLVDDFVISEAGGAVHVRNAPSPAATSSLAIAKLIVDRALTA
jgi:2-hydroxyglutarate dehydrogenase